MAELGHPTSFFSQDLEILSQDLDLESQDVKIVISGYRDKMSDLDIIMSGSQENNLGIVICYHQMTISKSREGDPEIST